MTVAFLPHVHAPLNGITAALLVMGYLFIKNGNKTAHKRCMISAVLMSILFLASYVIYHMSVGSVKFAGTGMVRPVYFTILITHTLLAAVMTPMILLTLYRAAKKRFESHRKIARMTLPIWIYVSITGIIVYLMVYHLFTPEFQSYQGLYPNASLVTN